MPGLCSTAPPLPPAAPALPSDRPAFTDDQLLAYLQRIRYAGAEVCAANPPAAAALITALRSRAASAPLQTLHELQTAQLRSIPFDNLGVHYSRRHGVSLESDDIFDKLVVRRRGGYCMEVTELFARALRTLGYELYSGGARVNQHFGAKEREKWEAGWWTGWDHMMLFVVISETKYLVSAMSLRLMRLTAVGVLVQVDLGFGPRGPTRPMLLEPEVVVRSASFLSHRLVRAPLKASTAPRHAPEPWILQYRDDAASDTWTTTYTFHEIEFIPNDYKVMNWATSTAPGDKFAEMVIIGQWIWDEADQQFVGWHFLTGRKLVRMLNGTATRLATVTTEDARVQAIKEYFNVDLTDEEVRAMKGWKSELR
ncbi:N-terminal acetyltransferase [Ascosphaera acerosa]|nr:N-terminal acetyltransferase [Ascosphaera acerosa]